MTAPVDPFSTELRPTERQYERDQRKLDIAAQALRDIVRCDYRGNEPSEQMIARLALAEMERVR